MNTNLSTTSSTWNTGTTANVQDSPPGLSVITTVVLPIIFSIVFILGFIGNIIVIHIMKLMFSGKRISDLFLLHLAVADLLFASTLPLWAIDFALKKRWMFGDAICKIESWFTLTSVYGSVFFLTLISMDRLAAVVFHDRFVQYRTLFNAHVVTIVLWLLALLASLPALHYRRTIEFGNSSDDVMCDWRFDEDYTPDRIWYGIHFGLRFILGFAIPLVIIFICYLIIIIFLNRRKSKKKLLRKKQDRITLTIYVVVVVFIICWLPNQISGFIYTAQAFHIISFFSESVKLTQYHVHLFVSALAWSHSCINPYLYAFMRDDVRRELGTLLGRWYKLCSCESFAKYQKGTHINGKQCARNKLAKTESLKYTSPTRISLLKRTSLKGSEKRRAAGVPEIVDEGDNQERHDVSIV